MSEQSSTIISKVWGMCNPLRDDGVSYGDYLEQLTYLIFLKMSDEYARPPYNKQTGIPTGYTWADMNTLKGAELEEKYKDRNIVFVSISSDKDVAAWKKMVKMDKLGGVQLNIGTDRTFHNALKISSIPRFMLIDPEGNLVSDNAPRPSNSQIEILFDSMKGL